MTKTNLLDLSGLLLEYLAILSMKHTESTNRVEKRYLEDKIAKTKECIRFLGIEVDKFETKGSY